MTWVGIFFHFLQKHLMSFNIFYGPILGLGRPKTFLHISDQDQGRIQSECVRCIGKELLVRELVSQGEELRAQISLQLLAGESPALVRPVNQIAYIQRPGRPWR